MTSILSSRKFREYREQVRHREGADDKAVGSKAKRSKPRSFGRLLCEFWGLLRTHRRPVVVGLATLTVATHLRLIPPAGTKLAIDYVFTPGTSLPEWLAAIPGDREPLSSPAGDCRVRIADHDGGEPDRVVGALASDSGRQPTASRFATPSFHARDSASAAPRLRFEVGRSRQPAPRGYRWRGRSRLQHDLQPLAGDHSAVGSLLILVWVDWRMMLGGLLLVPIVFFSHRTWINRIRPLYRDVRSRRQEIDSNTAEAFGGMRVVRAFNRQKSEASRYVRANDLLIRQQLFVWWWARAIELVWEWLIPLAPPSCSCMVDTKFWRGT
jgi:ATP-binding cassette, subfamily B, bacterial